MPSPAVVHHYGCDEKHAPGQRCSSQTITYGSHGVPSRAPNDGSWAWVILTAGILIELTLVVVLFFSALWTGRSVRAQ
jgi:hypothetical protein